MPYSVGQDVIIKLFFVQPSVLSILSQLWEPCEFPTAGQQESQGQLISSGRAISITSWLSPSKHSTSKSFTSPAQPEICWAAGLLNSITGQDRLWSLGQIIGSGHMPAQRWYPEPYCSFSTPKGIWGQREENSTIKNLQVESCQNLRPKRKINKEKLYSWLRQTQKKHLLLDTK